MSETSTETQPGEGNAAVLPDQSPPQPPDPTGGYDPGAHTVDDVVAYLVEHPEAVEAVKAAEGDGKARKGIMGYEAPAPEGDTTASSPVEPLVQEGTEDYDRRVIYPEDHPDAVEPIPEEEPTEV